MTCDPIREQLTAYVLGDMDASAAAAVRTHLDTCRDCQATVQEIESTLGLVRDALAGSAAKARGGLSPERRQRALAALAEVKSPESPPDESPWRWLTGGHPRLAFAAGLVLVAGVLWMVMPHAKQPAAGEVRLQAVVAGGAEFEPHPAAFDHVATPAPKRIQQKEGNTSIDYARSDAEALIDSHADGLMAAGTASERVERVGEKQKNRDVVQALFRDATTAVGETATDALTDKACGLNNTVESATTPRSTFAIDVDTASYTQARQFMNRGLLPPPEAVRTEAFINFFDYDYPASDGAAFRIHAELAPSGFGHGEHLLKLGINTIASDVKIQVEFNPAVAPRYRQLGYENHQLTAEQFRDDRVDAGELGSGQSATALYELRLAEADPNAVVAIVRVRYRDLATGKVEEIALPVRADDARAASDAASTRFRLATCVAEFAEQLRGSPFAAGSTFDDVAAALRPVALELKLDRHVQELQRLVEQAGGMRRAPDTAQLP